MKRAEENQWVKMGAHHTLEIELNNKLTLGKDPSGRFHSLVSTLVKRDSSPP